MPSLANPELVQEALKRRAVDLGMNQSEVARAAKLDQTTVSDLFSGARLSFSATTLGKVAMALGWTADSIQRLDRSLDVVEHTDPDTRRPAAASGLPLGELDEHEQAVLDAAWDAIRAMRRAAGKDT